MIKYRSSKQGEKGLALLFAKAYLAMNNDLEENLHVVPCQDDGNNT